MSYALGLQRASSGFGSDPALSLSQLTTGGAVGLGAQSILTDSSVMQGINPQSGFPTLSPFSVINLSMLSGVFSNALEGPLESAAASVISALPASLVGTIADVVGDVVDIVPVIGPIFKAIFDILSGDFGSEPNYGGSADESRDCQLYMSWFQVQGTGAVYENCQTCPTDLFFPGINYTNTDPTDWTPNPCDPATEAGNADYFPTCCGRWNAYSNAYPWNIALWGDPEGIGYNTPPRTFQDLYASKMPPNWVKWLGKPGQTASWSWRPAIGQALMMLTEGGVIDAFEITDGAQRLAFAAWSDKAYDKARSGFTSYLKAQGRAAEATWWTTYGGIPPTRRAQFRALRRGIQACNAYYGLSDGGVSLWPIYMDLLLDSFDRGQINPEFIGYMLTYQFLQGALDSGACWLVDKNGNQITAGQEGMLMNQNLFGNGFMVNGDPGNTISACAQVVQDMVTSLLNQWRINTQKPETQFGADKLAQYAAQAQLIGSGQSARKLSVVPPGGLVSLIGTVAPPVKKVHKSAAILGAATAAAAIYLFL